MRLLLVGGTSAALGGVERYCERFVEAFRACSAAPVQHLAADTASAGASLPAYARRLAASAARVRRAAAALDPRRDAVWVQYGNAADLALVVALRRAFRGRLLVTAHAGEQWRHLRSPRGRAAAAWALRRADVVCALSDAQRALWAAAGVDARVVPTLLPAWVNAPPPPAPRREGILFAGRISPEKGVHDLLDACAAAGEGGPPVHMAGAGDDGYLHALRERAERLGIARRVHWHGPLDEGALLALMRSCRVLAYPSYADAWPLSVLEAFAAGMRVVAYAVPGTAQMLAEHGGAAVPPGAVGALAVALAREAEAEPADAAAAALRARLAWPQVVRGYEALAGAGAR